MNFLWLAAKDLMLFGRDRKALLTLVLMPMILIGILGAAFGNMMGEGEADIDKFTLGIVNLDEGELGKVLTQEVFEKGLPELVEVKTMEEDKLYDLLKEQKVSVGLFIGKDFSNTVLSGEETAVKLVSMPSAGIQPTIVENVVQQFTRQAAVQSAGMKLAIEAAAKTGSQVDPQVASWNSVEADSSALLKERAAGEDAKTVSSFQYYAAGMGVMFLLITVVAGVSAMIQEKEQEVYKRLLVTKLTNGHYLAGKMAGLLVIASIQLLIIILGTRLIFGVDWGSSVLGVLLISVCFVFSACGLGVFVGSLMKTGKSFEVVGSLGTQIMAAIGGSMVPLYFFHDFVVMVTRIFPNALALQSFLELMGGAAAKDVVLDAAVLLSLGLVFLAAGWLRLSAEGRGKYA
ncbi:ABC transporter permease [Bacillus sp. EB01]|uniref:ABC transporter permease n=1 Tax=Bacillus sp. EB01 TaxID=1347086 RepID=UPI0005C78F98|nr:ABC transporter permease [Bacillus sp. EB01]